MKIEHLYTLKKPKVPGVNYRVYPTKHQIDNIFAVPVDNAVGTNDLWNAISLVHFKEKKVDIDIVKKDFIKYVSGGDLYFTPVFDEQTIGYAQTRGFLLFNLKTTQFIDHMICKLIDETINNVHVVDGAKRIFLFEIDYFNPIRFLRLVDLSTDKVKVLGELKIEEEDTGWTVHKDRIFLFQNGDIKVLNLNFQPVQHPVVNFIMTNKEKFHYIGYLLFHPKDPFAILLELDESSMRRIAWVVTWNPFLLKNPQLKIKEEPFKLYKLFQYGASTYGFQWSPDSNWLTFLGGIDGGQNYYVMKVDYRIPGKLSAPIPLGEFLKYPWGVTTWTTNPLSFVVAGEKKLIRYNVGELKDVRIDELVKMIDELNE